MKFKRILIEKKDSIGIICLNSPDTLNLIEKDTFEEINKAFDFFEEEESIKIILLKALCGFSKKNIKIFSAGVNLKEYNQKFELLEKKPEKFKKNIKTNRALLTKIEQSKKPVVMGIDGGVVGGFFELALCCDLILASESAFFSLSEVNIGLIPGYGGIHRLLNIVGKNKTFEIISSGRKISADEAFKLGIVSEIYNDNIFHEKINEYCLNLTKKSSNSLKLIKDTIYKILNQDKIEEIEINNFIKAVSSEEAKQGIQNFLERKNK